MCNPSTANDVFNDPTIRRCIGFAKVWGYSGLVVTNLFAFRATNPKDLRVFAAKDLPSAIGIDNDAHLGIEARSAETIVCAWGNNGTLRGRDIQVIGMLSMYDLYCIRLSKDGNPVHPVREEYTRAPIKFRKAIVLA
jgi:hypothetical protein